MGVQAIALRVLPAIRRLELSVCFTADPPRFFKWLITNKFFFVA